MNIKKLFRQDSVSERHPDETSKSNRHYDLRGFIQFKKMLVYIDPLGWIELKGNNPEQIFTCLRLLDDPENSGKNAIIINNECRSNQLILLDRTCDRFYFGFDLLENIISKGVFPAKKAKGTDFSIVNEQFIVIIRNFKTFNIIRNLLDSSQV
jgi:hypothetical protein